MASHDKGSRKNKKIKEQWKRLKLRGVKPKPVGVGIGVEDEEFEKTVTVQAERLRSVNEATENLMVAFEALLEAGIDGGGIHPNEDLLAIQYLCHVNIQATAMSLRVAEFLGSRLASYQEAIRAVELSKGERQVFDKVMSLITSTQQLLVWESHRTYLSIEAMNLSLGQVLPIHLGIAGFGKVRNDEVEEQEEREEGAIEEEEGSNGRVVEEESRGSEDKERETSRPEEG